MSLLTLFKSSGNDRMPKWFLLGVTDFSVAERRRAMHPLFTKAAGMTHDVIGAAIEVHQDKGAAGIDL